MKKIYPVTSIRNDWLNCMATYHNLADDALLHALSFLPFVHLCSFRGSSKIEVDLIDQNLHRLGASIFAQTCEAESFLALKQMFFDFIGERTVLWNWNRDCPTNHKQIKIAKTVGGLAIRAMFPQSHLHLDLPFNIADLSPDWKMIFVMGWDPRFAVMKESNINDCSEKMNSMTHLEFRITFKRVTPVGHCATCAFCYSHYHVVQDCKRKKVHDSFKPKFRSIVQQEFVKTARKNRKKRPTVKCSQCKCWGHCESNCPLTNKERLKSMKLKRIQQSWKRMMPPNRQGSWGDFD